MAHRCIFFTPMVTRQIVIKPLLERFATQHQTFGMLLRPLWLDSKPEEIKDWNPFSEDLIELLDERKLDSVIGVGHSIGAIVTLRAALKHQIAFARWYCSIRFYFRVTTWLNGI